MKRAIHILLMGSGAILSVGPALTGLVTGRSAILVAAVGFLLALCADLKKALGPLDSAKVPIAILVALSSFGACKHVPAPVAAVADCTNQRIAHQVPDLLATVETDLAAADYLGLLTALGERVGFDVVDCVVSVVLDGSIRHAEYAKGGDPLASVKIVHAQAWLTRSN